MFWLIQLFLSLYIVTAVPGGGLIKLNERFVKIDNGKWLNTSIVIYSSYFYSDEGLLVNLLALYDHKDFEEFYSIIGIETAIIALDLDDRATLVLFRFYNITTSIDEGSDPNTVDSGGWMKFNLQTHFSSNYPSSITQVGYGTIGSPKVYRNLWSRAKAGGSQNISKSLGLGDALKRNCRSTFIAVNSEFSTIGGDVSDCVPVFLVSVIPDTDEFRSWKPLITTGKIDQTIDVLLLDAFKNDMAMFWISVIKNTWFGSNSLGKLVVVPLVPPPQVLFQEE